MITAKIKKILGQALIVCAFIFLVSNMFLVRISSGVSYDLLGFVIPQPPVWTSFIPWLGAVIGTLFEFFSLHGLVTLIIFYLLMYLGIHIKKE